MQAKTKLHSETCASLSDTLSLLCPRCPSSKSKLCLHFPSSSSSSSFSSDVPSFFLSHPLESLRSPSAPDPTDRPTDRLYLYLVTSNTSVYYIKAATEQNHGAPEQAKVMKKFGAFNPCAGDTTLHVKSVETTKGQGISLGVIKLVLMGQFNSDLSTTQRSRGVADTFHYRERGRGR